MKLSEHVDTLRDLIEAAFDKGFARLGIGTNKQLDIEKLPDEVRPKRLRFEEMLQSHVAETGGYEQAREKLIDELTFTLFNRLAAVKVMEAAKLFPPVLTKQPEHGDRSFGHKAWLEMNPHMRTEELEGIREYLKAAFDELGEKLPLYSRDYPYALLPDAISLNEIIDRFNAVEKDNQVGSDIWQSDDVLGWTYESYNNKEKKAHKDSKDKTEYNKVSLQSQVYTPRWVVQFLVENSLGKLYLEMYPDSEIKRRYRIANAPHTQERKPKPLHEVKMIDPACGSGNFLLYAFDFFYELYVDQIENYGADYDEKDIPRLIIEHNLHGIDLDDRAVQLAQLGLFIKAKKKRRTVGELTYNVVSSDFYLPEYGTVEHIFTEGGVLEEDQQALIAETWTDLQYAYKFGSLIRLDEKVKAKLKMLEANQSSAQPELFAAVEIEAHKSFAVTFFTNLKTAVERHAQAQGISFLTSKTRDAITFLELLTTEYDVATANPPYIDSRDYGDELRVFLDDNYRRPESFYKNLYASFIKKTSSLIHSDGKVAIIHPRTFMFISTFKDARELVLDRFHIHIFVDYGLSNMFGAVMVDPCFYVLESKKPKQEPSIFIGVDEHTRTPLEKRKKDFVLQSLNDYCSAINNRHLYLLSQLDFKLIDGSPFIFWISSSLRKAFQQKSIVDEFDICNGVSSGGNNERFYRFWWEIAKVTISTDYATDKKKWVLINKGGDFNRWYGNLWLVFEWSENGKQLKDLKKKTPSIRYSSEEHYFEEGLAFSGSSTKGLSVRYQPHNCIFERSGKSIFPKQNASIWYLLTVLNSKLCSYIVDSLNPTVSFQSGDIDRIPLVIPDDGMLDLLDACSKTCIEIKKHLTEFCIAEPLFAKTIFSSDHGHAEAIKTFIDHENHLLTQVLINEAIINEKVFEVYDLTEHDKAMVLAKEGRSIGGLPVSPEARDAYLTETEATKEFPLDAIREFIEALPTQEFSAEERGVIESGFGTLYQSNNDLEEFCIRHQINPINVWHWFKQSSVIPQQRMHTLAMEFLADMVREILNEDEDGIIPLVPNAGEKVLLERVEEKFRKKGFSSAQYSSFDTVLGRPIHEYLNKHFFAELSDHLNLFMYLPKTPFIWHLSSGPEQGFDCYVIIYKWSRDKLMRLRSVYIEHRERSLVNRQSDLSGNESADAQNEKDRIFRQLKEIEAFKAKIDELLAEGYNPILDDGVGKNIAPLQKKKMIPYEVLNAGQLKKYLNADW